MFERIRARLRFTDPEKLPPLTPEQKTARAAWQRRWNLPIIIAAFVPLFVTSPDSRVVAIVVGVGSWIVFIVDFWVQRRIVPDYLRRRVGRIDLAIIVLTFPYYLLPGTSSYTGLLMLARLGRVARVLMATAGIRRFVARLGKVAVVAGLTVLIGSLAAWEAEHKINPEFGSIGDALWWGCVTITTVGYGDIVPETTAGRLAGVAIMFTGIAVIGVLAGSLASLFGLDRPRAGEEEPPGDAAPGRGMHDELAALRTELAAMGDRLGELAERAASEAAASPGTEG